MEKEEITKRCLEEQMREATKKVGKAEEQQILMNGGLHNIQWIASFVRVCTISKEDKKVCYKTCLLLAHELLFAEGNVCLSKHVCPLTSDIKI
jgi:hypothetical protein